jgi:hypothetical protein
VIPGAWRATPAALVAALALLVSLPALRNGFTLDDVPLVVENPRVHALLPPCEHLRQTARTRLVLCLARQGDLHAARAAPAVLEQRHEGDPKRLAAIRPALDSTARAPLGEPR